METYDIIIIGGGPGGYEAAAAGAAGGNRVLLIEKDQLGGTCLNRGCIPTKSLCRSASISLDLANASSLGINMADGGFSVDMTKIVARKDAIVSQLGQAIEALCSGVEILQAEACFIGRGIIEADGRILTAKKIVIATGSQPATLPIDGAELAIDSTNLLNLTTVPRSMVIIGGGVIGMEFASIFAALGTEVTVVEYCREVLPMFDKDMMRPLRTAMKKRGIEVHTEARVCGISQTEGELKEVCFECKGKRQTIQAEYVLMSVGRGPVLPKGLELTGVETSPRGIVVDSRYETTCPGIYAIGDCNGQTMLAHAASAQGRLVMGENVDLSVIPSAVFTMPECAMVGMTEEACTALNEPCITAKSTFRGNGKALAMGEGEGLVKVMVSPQGGMLLGCEIVGPHAADLIAEAALALSCHLTVADIIGTIHAHPTLSEAFVAACSLATGKISE